MKNYKFQFIVGALLIILGSAVIVAIIRSQQNNEVVAGPSSSSSQHLAVQPNAIEGDPSELILPSLNLDLSVIPGLYNTKTKTWTLSLDKVQYAVVTPRPNNVSGNTFIYGHYRKGVLATLHTIHLGDQAVVKTSNGHSFYYQLASVRTTDPSDDSVFNYRGKPILTIQTCTGLFFQNRQLFTFNLVRTV